ncbi:MAG: hypothetical protein HY319_10755 [Armatimonadetes bacterium]|nr:hypothetical protein [Armatimonadota bacterium]
MIARVGTKTPVEREAVARTLKEAVEHRDWVEITYHGKTSVVIPQAIAPGRKGDLLKAVRAEDSQRRSYSLGEIEGLEVLKAPEANATEVIGRLNGAIAGDQKVQIAYQLPGSEAPVRISIDPESFSWQPDHTLALDATRLGEHPASRHYRVDRILMVEDCPSQPPQA